MQRSTDREELSKGCGYCKWRGQGEKESRVVAYRGGVVNEKGVLKQDRTVGQSMGRNGRSDLKSSQTV
jgi:hypothetical protein